MKGDGTMKKSIRKVIAALTAVSFLLLTACSGGSTADTTTSPVSESTRTSEQTSANLARVVEIPYEDNNTATFTFNEKGLLISSENCPWGDDCNYYKYDEQNRITEIQHALWDGTIDDGCKRNIYYYGENGKIEKIVTFMGSKEKLQRYRVYEFEYNSDGLISKKTTKAGGNNALMETVENTYNESGKLVYSTLSNYGETSETFYEYNENGMLASINSVQKNGESNKTIYEYDAENKLIKEISDDYISNYEYENGFLVKETSENWYIEYKYYDNNRIIAAYFYGNDGISEIDISAVPEVMGNYSEITIAPLP